MENKEFNLTAADFNAISLSDSNYLNNKGASLYAPGTFKSAVEYYRLGAAMGNDQSISNLGYCYLYGRDIEKNLSLAIAYFKIAAMKKNVDAAYKLGDIYGSDKWGVEDKELSVYYYRLAANILLGENWESDDETYYNPELIYYPSLCFALGRELSQGGSLRTNINSAYTFLKIAEEGYKREIQNGSSMYEKAYEAVIQLLNDSQFDAVREDFDSDFSDDDDFIS